MSSGSTPKKIKFNNSGVKNPQTVNETSQETETQTAVLVSNTISSIKPTTNASSRIC